MTTMLVGRRYLVALMACLLGWSVFSANAQDKHMPVSPGLAPVVPRDPVQAETEKMTHAANTARISLVQAIKAAQQKVPGNPIEATLSADQGRPVYKVTILDGTGRLQIIMIDGIEGKAVANPK